VAVVVLGCAPDLLLKKFSGRTPTVAALKVQKSSSQP
jgi:hypothetical protein